jgi:hypothetical protein
MHHMIRGNLLFSLARIDMGPPVLLLLLYMQNPAKIDLVFHVCLKFSRNFL